MDADATNYFRTLYEIGADKSLSLEAKIERALTVGRDRLGVEYGVLSYTADGDYEIVDSTITDGKYVAGTTHDLDATWCRHVVGDQEVLAIADVDESAYHDDVARETTGLQCYIGAPILVDEEVYGTLCFSGQEPRADDFTDDDERFVRLLCEWVGYELERQQHYAAIEAQNDRLEEFAGILAHDLRNPLTAARGYTELVAESVDGTEADHLGTVLDSLDRMETLITDMLTLAREGTSVGERESVSLAEIARAAWGTVAPEGATLVVEDDRRLSANPSQLRQLFENAFRNVGEHCGEATTVTVRGTDEGFVVEDDGPGLPPAVAESVFGGDYEAMDGGLGLLIIERVVRGHGWDATVEVDDGTRFVVTGVGTVAERPAVA